MITIKEASPAKARKAYNQVNYNTTDERRWCRKCGKPAFIGLVDILTCANGCSFESDIGFMDSTERLEWLARKVIEQNELLPKLKAVLE